MMSFSLFYTAGIKAQNDAFFVNSLEHRTSTNEGHGFGFGSFEILPQEGFGIEAFEGEVPLTNGLFVMTATGLIYLMNKRRKENEK